MYAYNMDDIKHSIGILAIILTFVGYIPYIRDIRNGKTKPHVYSWFLWFSVTMIVFALQLSDGAGIGAFVTLAAAIIAFVIFLFGMRIGKKDIAKSDNVCLALAVIATILWLFADQPVLSVILLSAIEIFAFIPTIRKSWNNPYSETLSAYALNTVRFVLALMALQNYSIITTLYPAVWLVANGGFSIILILRRRALQ